MKRVAVAETLAELRAPADAAAPWRCRHCGTDNDGEFAACWKCGQADTDPGRGGG